MPETVTLKEFPVYAGITPIRVVRTGSGQPYIELPPVHTLVEEVVSEYINALQKAQNYLLEWGLWQINVVRIDPNRNSSIEELLSLDSATPEEVTRKLLNLASKISFAAGYGLLTSTMEPIRGYRSYRIRLFEDRGKYETWLEAIKCE